LISNRGEQGGIAVDTTLGVLRKVYGTKLRKGVAKLAYEHPKDVLDNCYIQLLEMRDGACVFRLALLHDVLEDGDMTAEELQEALDLPEEHLELLKLLARNYVPEGEDYLERTVSDSRAAVVKLADGIANLQDLIQWVREEKGFTAHASATAQKYMQETPQLIRLVEERYPLESGDLDHPFRHELSRLRGLLDELRELTHE